MERGLDWGRLLKKVSKSVSWVLDYDGTKKTTKRLERQKQTLALAMLFLGCEYCTCLRLMTSKRH